MFLKFQSHKFAVNEIHNRNIGLNMSLPSLNDNSLDNLYQWLNTVPLSKDIKNIARDFSDGG